MKWMVLSPSLRDVPFAPYWSSSGMWSVYQVAEYVKCQGATFVKDVIRCSEIPKTPDNILVKSTFPKEFYKGESKADNDQTKL